MVLLFFNKSMLKLGVIHAETVLPFLNIYAETVLPFALKQYYSNILFLP